MEFGEVGVDLMSPNGTMGDFAGKFRAAGLQINKYRPYWDKDKNGNWGTYMSAYDASIKKFVGVPIQTNATLLKDEWLALDTALVEISRTTLGGVQHLLSKNLVYNLPNAMGVTQLQWNDISDFGEASVDMDGKTRHRNDRPNFQHNYLPIPIIHMDYEINLRELEISRRGGQGLDTIGAERAGRRVAEKVEEMTFTNTTFSYGDKDTRNRNSIYSLINHPDRNIVSLGTPWTSLTTNIGKTIVDKIFAAKQAAKTALHPGPYTLYIPSEYELVLDKDYDADSTVSSTIRDRIMKISKITEIVTVDSLPADNVLLVQTTPDVIRMVRGFGLTNIQWSSEGGWINNYKVATIMVPQIRSDQNGKSGIVHLS